MTLRHGQPGRSSMGSLKPSGRSRRRRYHPWWLWRKVTAAVFLVLLILGTFSWFPHFRGSMTSTMLFDTIPFTDPLAAIEVILASRTLEWTFVSGALILIGLAVLVGPVFCGWICPLGLVLDLNHTIRAAAHRLLLRRRDLAPVASGTSHAWVKYVLLGAAIGFSFVAEMPIFQVLSPINLLVHSALFVLSPWIVVITALVVVEWFRPRLWCRSLCPLGALYGIIGQFGLLRVRINPALAGKTPCGECTRHCPMGIRVLEDFAAKRKSSVVHPFCTRCGECIDLCPKGVLLLRFRDIRADDPVNRIEIDDPRCQALAEANEPGSRMVERTMSVTLERRAIQA